MITDIRLQNFRSFEDASFKLGPGVNIIVGPNASGKTNLLEALLVLARGSSYRARDTDIIKFKSPWARLESRVADNNPRTLKLTREPEPAKTYEINGKNFSRLPQSHRIPVVLFEPEHLRMLTGSPERRRDYLDDLLEQTENGYGSIRRKYKRVLAQRNNLLKQTTRLSPAELFPWDVRLSELAGQIVRARSSLAGSINKDLPPIYKRLSNGKTRISVTYGHNWPVESYESRLLKHLENNRHEDIVRGFTSGGPHREDMLVAFNGRPAQTVASRGELRTAVLALKIVELGLQEAASGQTPLVLLDDVFSELDARRRHALTEYLAPYQTFITTTDADLVLQHFATPAGITQLDLA